MLQKSLLCKTGSLRHPDHQANGRAGSSDQQHMVGHKLNGGLECGRDLEQNHQRKNLVSCPNIAVRCDIVEYL